MAKRTCNCGECQKCKRREYMNAWYRRPGNAEKIRSWASRYRNANLDRVREYDRERGPRTSKSLNDAHNAVRHAIERGELARGPCEKCGRKPEMVDGRQIIHAHHEDHSRLLEVHWLCRSCHAIEHRWAAL